MPEQTKPTKPTVASVHAAVLVAGQEIGLLKDRLAEMEASGATLAPAANDVFGAIRAVQAELIEMGGIAKDTDAPPAAGGFKYRGIDAVMAAISPLLVKHHLTILPMTAEASYEMVPSGNKKEALIDLAMTYLVVGPGGRDDSIEVQIYAHGMNGRDKAATTANSYAWRTMVTQLFAIPVETDDGESRADEIQNVKTLSQGDLNRVAELIGQIPEHRRDEIVAYLDGEYGPSDRIPKDRFGDLLADLTAAIASTNAPAETEEEAEGKLADAGLTEPTTPAEPEPEPATSEATEAPKSRADLGIAQLKAMFLSIPEGNRAGCMVDLEKAELVPITELVIDSAQKAAAGIMENHGAVGQGEEPW